MKAIEKYLLNQRNYIIYCDMDGVLCDFDKQFASLGYGTTKEVVDNQGEGFFWKQINNSTIEFWSEMDWMPDGEILWDYIRPFKPSLLSSPGKSKYAPRGKDIWVRRELGPNVRLILKQANEKKQLATPTSILIDDMEKNINGWKENGGVGILHKNAKDTIDQLKKLING